MPIFANADASRPWVFIWPIRLVQWVFALIALGLAASDASDWGDIGCHSPARLNLNIAVAVLTFIFVPYLIFCTGPLKIFKIAPYIWPANVALDALLFILWLATGSAQGTYNCNDLCNACNFDYDWVWYGNLICECLVYVKREDVSANPAMRLPLQARKTTNNRISGSKSRPSSSKGSTTSALTAFDALLTILFFVTLVATVAWFFINRKKNNGARAATGPEKPTNPGEAQPLSTGEPVPLQTQQPYKDGSQTAYQPYGAQAPTPAPEYQQHQHQHQQYSQQPQTQQGYYQQPDPMQQQPMHTGQSYAPPTGPQPTVSPVQGQQYAPPTGPPPAELHNQQHQQPHYQPTQ